MTAPQESSVDDDSRESSVDDDVGRPRRQINPVALVVGLLYVAIGLGVLAERQWGGIDLGAIAGTGAVVAGIAVIVLIARR